MHACAYETNTAPRGAVYFASIEAGDQGAVRNTSIVALSAGAS